MNAAALQTLQVYVPRILKSHARDAERVALRPLEEISGAAGRIAVLPVPANIILGPGGRIIPDASGLRYEQCGWNQFPIFSQHGERRKGAVRLLSGRWYHVLHS